MAAENVQRNAWSSEMEAELIELVENKRHLWDIQSPLYTKKTLKQHSYFEICQYMKVRWPESEALFNYDAVLKKFQNLRTYYKREVKKTKDFKSGSGCDGFKPRWEHFSRMGFLNDGFVATESSCNLSPSPLNHPELEELQSLVEVTNNIEDLEMSRSISSAENFSQSPKPMEVVQKRKRKYADTELASTAQKVLESTAHMLKDVAAEKETENEAFAQYVKTALDAIDNPYYADLARRDIMDTLIKYKHNLI